MKYLVIILLVPILFLLKCASSAKSDSSYLKFKDSYIEVRNIKGKSIEEANENAKYKILEIGLNEIIETAPNSIQRYTREELDQYPVDKYIRDFSQMRNERSGDGFMEVDARARLKWNTISNDFFSTDYPDMQMIL